MNTILTVKDRVGNDLIHTVTRGNRRFVLMKEPERDMRGFLVEVRRVTPTMIRGQQLLEIVGVERFIADSVFIPVDRRGLYQNDNEALKFANGRIIKDTQWRHGLEVNDRADLRIAFDREVNDQKLVELEKLFKEQFQFRAKPEE